MHTLRAARRAYTHDVLAACQAQKTNKADADDALSPVREEQAQLMLMMSSRPAMCEKANGADDDDDACSYGLTACQAPKAQTELMLMMLGRAVRGEQAQLMFMRPSPAAIRNRAKRANVDDSWPAVREQQAQLMLMMLSMHLMMLGPLPTENKCR